MQSQTSSFLKISSHALPFSNTPFKNLTGISLPGISSETQQVTMDLLETNHKNFDIYFNNIGFHNHFVHHLLAAYSFGASTDVLKKLYGKHSSMRRPKLPSKVVITHDNWTDYIGRYDLWTDYLEFFDKVVKEDGMEKAINKYAFHPKMFPRLWAGFFHSAIHLGYGVEFQLPIIVAEGMAMTAVHEDEYEKLINEDYLSAQGNEKKSIMEIINSVKKDERFDIITYNDGDKTKKLMEERGDIVREIAKGWVVTETEEGIKEAVRELYDACVMIYGASGMRKGKGTVHLDFVLMHGLTTVLMIFVMLPYLSLDKQRMLIRAHFAALLAEYIARGRPELNVEALKNYEPKNMRKMCNPWLQIIEDSLQGDDVHVIKVIRALMRAEQEWHPSGKENIYVKIAHLTLESHRENGWRYDIGFEKD